MKSRVFFTPRINHTQAEQHNGNSCDICARMPLQLGTLPVDGFYRTNSELVHGVVDDVVQQNVENSHL